MEDGERVQRDKDGDTDPGYLAPREDKALKYKWERLGSTKKVNDVYLWYKHTQETSIGFGIPLIPFGAIVIKQKEYGLCMPGMGARLYDLCGSLLYKVLRRCIPDDDTEEA